jgi:hypothetical protein
MSDVRQYEVTITAPMSVRVWAADEEEAKRKAVMREGLLAIGFPEAITVVEIEEPMPSVASE